jgi:ATP-dependent helicase STH1/SNF2
MKAERHSYHTSTPNAYLDSLAQAAVAEQNNGGPMHETGFEQEEGPANEASAQTDADDIADDKKVDHYLKK